MEDKIDHVDLGDTYVGEGHHYITFDNLYLYDE